MNAASSAVPAHTELFRFSSLALPEETLHVVRFTGQEGLNELFRFTIHLVSRNLALDTGKLLSDRAIFRILREDGTEAVFSGYPAEVSQQGAFNGYAYYTVELRPALWKLTRIVQSRIFLNQTLRETVEELLRSQEFFSFPHRFEFTGSDYPRREFAMQHEESLYDYLLWRLENQGAYYYFAQTETADELRFADSPIAHKPLPNTPELFYSPVSGLEGSRIGEILSAFTLVQSQLPKQVVIRSYSWENPNKAISGSAMVSPDGLGDVYLVNEDVTSDAEAARLARIRAEELQCRARRFQGAGSVPNLRPGYTFALKGHYNAVFNQSYLVTTVCHEGSQESFLNLGLGIPLEGVTDHLFYRNSFSCIEAKTPFRPERRAPRARISGVIHAFIDGAGDGSRPELDEYGRYRILFPFDVSGRKEGKASCWVRRAQEQVGKNSGMSFPLLNGVEVLVSFVDGDPDRPYITGALANAETGALTGNGNADFSGINTPGGSALVFNDSPGKQGMGMVLPSGSGLVMGAGSMDVGVKSASFWLDAASLTTNFSGIASSLQSSYLLKQKTCNTNLANLFKLISTALGNIFGSTSKSLKSAGEETAAMDWGLEMAKMSMILVSLISPNAEEIAKFIGGVFNPPKPPVIPDQPETTYAYAISGTEDKSSTTMQSFPNKKQMLAGIIFDLIAKTGKIAGSSKEIKEAFDKESEKEANEQESLADKEKSLADNDRSLADAEYERQKALYNYHENQQDMSKRDAFNEADQAYQVKKVTYDRDKAQSAYDKAESALNEAKERKEAYPDDPITCVAYEQANMAYQQALNEKKAANEAYDRIVEKKDYVPTVIADVLEADVTSDLLKAKTNQEKAKTNQEKAKTNQDKARTKKLAIQNARAQSIGQLVPEVVALIITVISSVVSYSGRSINKGKWGGILINAPKTNINLMAGEAIGVHSGRGVLMQTGDRLKEKINEMYTDVIIDDKNYGPYQRWGSHDTKGTPPPPPPPPPPFDPSELFNFYNDNAVRYTLAPNPKGADLQALPFIADSAPLRYTDAEYSIENVEMVRKSQAKKHIAAAGEANNESALVVQKAIEDDVDYTPQAPSKKAGIFLTTKGSQTHIVLRAGNNDSIVTASANGIRLRHKKDASVILLKDSVVACKGKTMLVLKEGQLQMIQDGSEILVEKGKISQNASNQKYLMGCVEVDGSAGKITNVTDVSGAIKILVAPPPPPPSVVQPEDSQPDSDDGTFD